MPLIIYRNFMIYYDPPPIPIRTCDWHAVHKDYDGPEDNRFFHAASEKAARKRVDEWWEEQAP